MTAMPDARHLEEKIVHLDLGADVDAARRLVDDQHLGPERQPAGEHHLLLVAAGKIGDELLGAGHADVERACGIPRPARAPCASSMKMPQRCRCGRAPRWRGWCGWRAPGTAPAACGPPAPGRCRARIASRGERIVTGLPSMMHAAGVERIGAEDGARHLGAAGADQAGDAEDLAVPDRERDVVEDGGAADRCALPRRESPSTASATSPAYAGSRWAKSALTSRPTIRRMMPSIVGVGDRAAADHACRRAAPCSGRRSRITSSRRWVTKMMLRPCALRSRMMRKSFSTSARAQRRGRLVHDDQARFHRERAGDLDHLLLGDREVADQRHRACGRGRSGA